MNRIEALRYIVESHPGAAFVFSNGLTSREANHYFGKSNHFYLLHGMGEALSVGIGLATAQADVDVVVVDGDGNALMGMAAWSLLPQERLYYYVLHNGLYETTGGQELPSLPVCAHVQVVSITPGKTNTPNPDSPAKIADRFCNWLKNPPKDGKN